VNPPVFLCAIFYLLEKFQKSSIFKLWIYNFKIMKNFSSLKLKDYVSLLGVYIIGFGWLLIDQIFLPAVWQRFVALFILLLILFYLQFSVNKPVKTFNYANSIALVTFLFISIISIVLHAFIKHDFSSKLILMWIISGVLPYLSGFIYQITKTKG
jgi:hypothetical protein